MAYTLLTGADLIDGSGNSQITDAAVLIQDDRIAAVGRRSEIDVPSAASVVDLGGGTLLPGFIDTHVHFMLEGVNIARDMVTPFSTRFYASVDRMRRTLDAGITTVRDAGGSDAGIKHAVETGIVPGPRMQISISVLTITGGHVDFWMRSGNTFNILMPHAGMPDGCCDGIDGVRKKVREVLRAGADVIKICSTGGVMSPTDHPDFTQFSPEELEIIVREARYRNNTKVMAHAQGAEGILNALRAGVHSIEHGIYLTDVAIDLMVRQGTYLVPTLLAPVSVLEAGAAGGIADYALRKCEEVYEAHKESIRRAHKAGVRISMGTDAGVMPHGTNLRELGLMVSIGMTPMEAIVASTRTAAECMGWADRIGTVTPGKLADLVFCSGSPLDDITVLENTANIRMVMKSGSVVKRVEC